MERIEKILKSEFGATLSEEFVSGAFFDSTMDYVEYINQDCITVSDRVDEFLTVILEANTHNVVGFRLKGFRCIFNELKPELGDKDFIPLIKVIEKILNLVGEDVLSQQRERKEQYTKAMELAEKDSVELQNVQQLAA